VLVAGDADDLLQEMSWASAAARRGRSHRR
jgi:hypothetical protein